MTRGEAYALCKRICGTDTAIETMNRLNEAGLISDECIEPRDVPTCDLIAAAEKLNQTERQ